MHAHEGNDKDLGFLMSELVKKIAVFFYADLCSLWKHNFDSWTQNSHNWTIDMPTTKKHSKPISVHIAEMHTHNTQWREQGHVGAIEWRNPRQ